MIILVYTGSILFCYGIYNILSYYSVLTSTLVCRGMKQQGGARVNALIIELSGHITKKWDLEWKGNDKLSKILNSNNIYYPVTVYCISLILNALCGLFLCLPLLFWNRIWFVLLSAAVLVYVLSDPLLLLFRYRKSSATLEKTESKQKSNILDMKKIARLLAGVFFLCQMVLLIVVSV